MTSEHDEWLEEMTSSWTEVYKKSMTTVVVLGIVRDEQPITVQGLVDELAEQTGWTFTERGLYRTVRRLIANGVLRSTDVPVPRTGVKRKDLTLTELGAEYLERIRGELIG
ncbi:hypothetical protein GCM10022199_22320 [Marihabitans asiaticum]|uniref:PadR family transcriptional regulator n=1 Tax=Marihabitans asiaticum TaxID=415218 RepID=A0A560WA88_9MICO|nr:helix-turn-helix transcriptional regulator [Marihabitans asiaticum]TWD14543.1 PadR family transcriptional regulator [Marihabitans asiaticum]